MARPRRSKKLAAPFLVTVSMLPACAPDPPLHINPPPPPPTVHGNPPPPPPEPPPPQGKVLEIATSGPATAEPPLPDPTSANVQRRPRRHLLRDAAQPPVPSARHVQPAAAAAGRLSEMSRPRASQAVRDEWLRRVEAEYRSAALTQHLGLWLIQIGASPDLIRASLRITRDELAHANSSHRVYLGAGGDASPTLSRDALSLPRDEARTLEHDVAMTVLGAFCLGETVAVRLFSSMHRRCTVPRARAVIERVLRDEVRHRDFGWQTLAWLLERDPSLRGAIEAALPTAFSGLLSLYAPPTSREQRSIADDDTAWGLLPGAAYLTALDQTARRDYLPRLARLGIDARASWAQARASADDP